MSGLQLVKNAKFAKLSLKNQQVIVNAVRFHWNKDFKPGPYPVTDAEREAAAKKYNVNPKEYEPYRDDGTGYGDYPKFKARSAESKDPFYPYDFPEYKRNFNEPLHVDFDLIREDRYNINAQFRPSCIIQYLQFFGVMGGSFLLYWLCEHIKMFHPIIPKQYPDKDKKHYTFELTDS